MKNLILNKGSKKLVSVLLAVVTLFCSVFSFGGSAEAATTATVNAWDTPTSTKYAIVYTVSTSGNTIPYTTSSLSTRGTITYGKSTTAYISNSSDELYLLDAGMTNGKAWAKVSYPIGSNKRAQAYIPLSAISSSFYAKKHTYYKSSTGKFNVSLRKGGSKQSSHYVAKGDSVYVLDIASTKSNNVQICIQYLLEANGGSPTVLTMM